MSGEEGHADGARPARSGGPCDPARGEPAEPAWRRRQRLARIFGDVLPDTTADEREQRGEEPPGDAWLRSQVPPHHGG
jgi:hypothetical protein